MSLKKAYIKIHMENGGPEIQCTFNPSEYSIRHSVTYKEKTTVDGQTKPHEFIATNHRVFSTTLYFDSFEEKIQDGDGIKKAFSDMYEEVRAVNELYKDLLGAMEIVPKLHVPPRVTFIWGNLAFNGVISDLSESFTMFTPFGKPVRAKVDITIQSELKAEEKKIPKESPDRTKSKVITQDTSLWAIANEEYDDCEKWRVIAKANNLMNPLDIKPGQMIKVPAIT